MPESFHYDFMFPFPGGRGFRLGKDLLGSSFLIPPSPRKLCQCKGALAGEVEVGGDFSLGSAPRSPRAPWPPLLL